MGQPEDDLRMLVDLAVRYHDEAERCAKADCYRAACVMIGVALEARLLAMTTIHEADLRMNGSLKPREDRNSLQLGQLVSLAVTSGWLSSPSDDATESVTPEEVRQVVKFVQNVRNSVAHPGRYLREADRAEPDRDTYGLAHQIVRTTFDYTKAHLDRT